MGTCFQMQSGCGGDRPRPWTLSCGPRISLNRGGRCQICTVHRPLWLSVECGWKDTRPGARGRPKEPWENVGLLARCLHEGLHLTVHRCDSRAEAWACHPQVKGMSNVVSEIPVESEISTRALVGGLGEAVGLRNAARKSRGCGR